MPAAVTMPLVVTVYGAASIVAALLALALAGAKRRDGQSWAFWSFIFPPLLLALIFAGRRSSEEAQQRKLLQTIKDRDGIDD